MGVTCTGKSTVGEKLAQLINAKFIDGDDLHPKANIIKMQGGQALNDEDREPWLERIRDAVFSLEKKNELGIIVCSALKKRYRDKIREDNNGVVFIFLDGDFDLITERMQARKGHFMPAGLIKSQFETLERPDAEPDVLNVSVKPDILTVVEACKSALQSIKVVD